jgi:two-component system phosphate regulon sensor histidine kinase PhoR
MRSIASERKGVAVIAVSLAVILSVIALIVFREVELRREQMRVQGIGLASALSRVPLERLVPKAGGAMGPLPILRSTQARSLFAYAAVVDLRGRVLASVIGAGPSPRADEAAPVDPSHWMDEIALTLGPQGIAVREFTAPLLEEGRLVAIVRIGFREPTHAVVLSDTPSLAAIALLVFLLIPAAYLWLRSEIRPLQLAAAKLVEPGAAGVSHGHALLMTAEEIAARMLELSNEVAQRERLLSEKRLELLASSRVLSHQKTRAESIVATMPEAILCLDSSGRVISANARAHGYLRRGDGALVGEALDAWCPSPVLAAAISHSLNRHGNALRPERVEFAAEGAERRHFLASIQELPDGATWIVVLRDVSEEVVARQTQAQFLSHMVHELKAPLNVISIYAESLLQPEAEGAEYRASASNVIRDETQRLNGLIASLFSLSRMESGDVQLDRQRIRTEEFFRDLLAAASRTGGELSLSFAYEPVALRSPIFADKALLSVVVNNLLTNAVKYNRQSGSVTLLVEESPEGLSIRVSDTGVGISEADLERVFDKFFRSDDPAIHKVAGHGLGLSLVKEVVALHGGEIRVTSAPGAGSEFSIFFPRTAAIFQESA